MYLLDFKPRLVLPGVTAARPGFAALRLRGVCHFYVCHAGAEFAFVGCGVAVVFRVLLLESDLSVVLCDTLVNHWTWNSAFRFWGGGCRS